MRDRIGSRVKNPTAPEVTREAEEDWGAERSKQEDQNKNC